MLELELGELIAVDIGFLNTRANMDSVILY